MRRTRTVGTGAGANGGAGRGRAWAVAALAAWTVGCGGDSGGPGVPQILNINNSTDPATPVGVAIEINGSGFLAAPGRVNFAQGTNVAEIAPPASAWSETGIVVSVPAEGAQGPFAVPGVLAVTVTTSGGTSNAVELDLVTTPVFSVENVRWSTTTPLPLPLRGHGAAAVPNTPAQAWLLVLGGNDGGANLASVYVNALAADGTLGGSWTTTAPLPAPRAHHGVAVAHPGNAPVPLGQRYVYVLGGQAGAADAPGGTSTVFVGSVAPSTGAVTEWRTTTALPAALVGPAVALYNGYLYVVGGLRPDGTPSAAVYSAPIRSDGSLGAWTTAPNAYPEAVAFATAFGFGGNLYVLGGDPGTSTDPNAQGGAGTKSVRYARARNGAVGPWAVDEALIKQRKKHVHWIAFGQIIAAEGVYEGNPGSLELERTLVEADGTLAAWNGITSSANQIDANVYNAAAVVSPIRPADAGPRFLLLGGQRFTLTPPGGLSDAVYVNVAP
jgi:hypothetical protein